MKMKLFAREGNMFGFLLPDINYADPHEMLELSHAGLSFYCVIGAQYGGFAIGFNKGIRIVLGWIGFGIINVDIETALARTVAALQIQRERLNEFEKEN